MVGIGQHNNIHSFCFYFSLKGLSQNSRKDIMGKVIFSSFELNQCIKSEFNDTMFKSARTYSFGKQDGGQFNRRKYPVEQLS